MTDEEVDYMKDKCQNYKNDVLYFVSYDLETKISLFYGTCGDYNMYYIKTVISDCEVNVFVGETCITYKNDGFYYIGSINKNDNVDRIDFIIKNADNTVVYSYYL